MVFDDLRSNATLTAMLAYLAAEDSTTVTRERADLVALAREAQAAAAAAGPSAPAPRRGYPTTWPTCEKAPRKTEPRLK